VVRAAKRSVCLVEHHGGHNKFYYVISQLDNKYAQEVEDVIINPHPHDRINAELIRCLSLSQEKHVRQLLMHEEMGD
jgi:hypothetical protein